MRIHLIAIAFAAAMQVTPALADAKADTMTFYRIIASATSVVEEAMADFSDAEYVVAELELRVDMPLAAATKVWTKAAIKGGAISEAYQPYAGCLDAATALADVSTRMRGYLTLVDKEPFTSGEADAFRAILTVCQTVLGVEITFR